jgi:hypothetical protein
MLILWEFVVQVKLKKVLGQDLWKIYMADYHND